MSLVEFFFCQISIISIKVNRVSTKSVIDEYVDKAINPGKMRVMCSENGIHSKMYTRGVNCVELCPLHAN